MCTAAERPEPGDQAAELLDDKMLDPAVAPEGCVGFALAVQG